MLLQDFLPSPAVRELVRYYRIVHFEFDRSTPIPFKAYPPKPEQCLHFFLREPFAIETAGNSKSSQPSIVFSGQRTSLVKQYNGPSFLDVQVVFQPTAFFRLTGIPADELTDQHIDATVVFPKTIHSAFEQLQLSKSYAGMLAIVEAFSQDLVSHLPEESVPMDAVSRQMVLYGQNTSINRLAQESCLCTKQFERKFKQRTGVNPKTYSKIIRFNRAYNLRNQSPEKDWLGIAIESGYFDYQHLTKDYKYLTGLTPPDLHSLESNSPENVLGLTKSLYLFRMKETL